MNDLAHLTLDQLLIRADGQHQRAGIPRQAQAALLEVHWIHDEIEWRRSNGVLVS